MKYLVVALLLCVLTSEGALAAEKDITYSAQFLALAPNAGGQNAYALRRANDHHEWSLLINDYLTAGGYPLLGVTYDWRFPICDQSCFWQFYVQIGGGLTTAGPVGEILWGTIPFWVLRIDFATQIFAVVNEDNIPHRLITWSYPLWVGFSLPL